MQKETIEQQYSSKKDISYFLRMGIGYLKFHIIEVKIQQKLVRELQEDRINNKYQQSCNK